MSEQAHGTFEVQLTPQTIAHTDSGLGRLAISKRFAGDLEATSVGEMLSARTPIDGSAGYVAMERVTGVLNGRRGSFVLQHSGSMNRGAQQLAITIVPDSGSDELAGISGSLAITIADGVHSYELHYSVPQR
ncbi:MAG: DUF3224 domain-containing protein [Oscillochloris sp.]|nr:DUF3224 domain-containing protein [Oscillochloris sp.]